MAGFGTILDEADPRRLPRPHRQHPPGAAPRVQGLARGRRRARRRGEGHRLHGAPRARSRSTTARSSPRRRCRCSPDDTVETLHERIKEVERRLYPEVLRQLVERRARRRRAMRALLSVYDKTGLVEFARGLHELGVRARVVGRHRRGDRRRRHPRHRASPTSPAFPEMLDHRVVTLHPKIHGGILADRGKASHRRRHEPATASQPFDLVVSNLYPFARVARHRDHRHRRPRDDARGGEEPRVRRDRHRAPTQYDAVLAELARTTARVGDDTRRALALEAFARTAAYDAAIVAWLQARRRAARSTSCSRSSAPTRRCATARTRTSRRRATASRGTTSWWDGVRAAQRRSRSRYLNLYDADAAWRLVHDLGDQPDGARSSSTPTRAASRSPTTSPPRTSARSSATSAPRSAASSR